MQRCLANHGIETVGVILLDHRAQMDPGAGEYGLGGHEKALGFVNERLLFRSNRLTDYEQPSNARHT
jgi:hypothetical protein